MDEGKEVTLRAKQKKKKERKQLCSLSLGEIKQVRRRTLESKKKKKNLMLEMYSYFLGNKTIKK